MSLTQLLVLALVQGVTEFLPISSSGHLALIGRLGIWPDQGLSLDVALHAGTLLAVALYCRREIWGMLCGGRRALAGKPDPLLLHLVVATIPVVLAGAFFYDLVAASLRDIRVIAWATLGFGLALGSADRVGKTWRPLERLTVPAAVVIGLAQVLALIPGSSRSGLAMSAARLLGMPRVEAARFSLLLSIPTIAGAVVLTLAKEETRASWCWDLFSGAAGASFLVALVSIALMMKWLQRASFTPFVLYRLLVGGALLVWLV